MAARKPGKKAKAEDEEIESPFLPPVILDPRALEKTMYDLTRIINHHDFNQRSPLATRMKPSITSLTPCHSGTTHPARWIG